jgi:protocatechuate 3,4-dioxygenase beta subunit
MKNDSEQSGHGLAADVDRMLGMAASRRKSLRWLLAGAALPMAGCSGGAAITGSAGGALDATAASGSTASPGCAVIPDETAGPFPADGTNSSAGGVANALALAGVVRSDIRSSIAGARGVAAGIELTIRLQLVNVGAGCASVAGAAVYAWHCDRAGGYSMYSSWITGENYLRGVQEADSKGALTFTTVVPGCYPGRVPHVHFEVYPSLARATSAANRIKTSQFTFPMAMLNEAYASPGYESSVRNLANISYATDNVFNDGTTLQMASVSGSAAEGYVATLTVGVFL